jgi:hypothetical protein
LSDAFVEDFGPGELQAVLDKLFVSIAKGARKADHKDRQ